MPRPTKRRTAADRLPPPTASEEAFEELLATAPEQERLEAWIMEEVEKGASLPGLYPPNAENKARYEKSKKA